MENAIIEKRGLVIVLFAVTVIVFIGFVWLIITYVPWDLLGFSSQGSPTQVVQAQKNCTRPVEYWRQHPELYPSQMVIGNDIYTPDGIKAALQDENDDLSTQLKAQLTSTFLNISAGASQSSIEGTIFNAYGWLVKHPEGSELSDSDAQDGNGLFTQLEAYNRGLSGIQACADAALLTPSATSTVTDTPVQKGSLTPATASMTPSLTPTPTPTSSPTPLHGTQVSATSTPRRTTGFTPNVTRTPTRTPIWTASRTPFGPTPTRTPTPRFILTNTWTATPITSTPIAPTNTRTATPKPPTSTRTATPITPTRTITPTLTYAPTATPKPTTQPPPTLPPTPTP